MSLGTTILNTRRLITCD